MNREIKSQIFETYEILFLAIAKSLFGKICLRIWGLFLCLYFFLRPSAYPQEKSLMSFSFVDINRFCI